MGAPNKFSEGQEIGQMIISRIYRERRVEGDGWKYLADLVCTCGRKRTVERGNLARDSFNPKCLICSGNGGGKLSHGHSISRKDKDPRGYNCYTRWQSMKRRCYTPSERSFTRYGGRGIKVCDRWKNSYENFLEDMGLPPNKESQIDRINNDGNYEPENCRWASREENAANKSNNRSISCFGKTMILSDWARETGIKRETIARRLERGWPPERALS